MATAEPLARLSSGQAAPSTELADQWRKLTRAATAVFLLTSPALALYFHEYSGWSWLRSILGALGLASGEGPPEDVAWSVWKPEGRG